jgi:hypothetical protein
LKIFIKINIQNNKKLKRKIYKEKNCFIFMIFKKLRNVVFVIFSLIFFTSCITDIGEKLNGFGAGSDNSGTSLDIDIKLIENKLVLGDDLIIKLKFTNYEDNDFNVNLRINPGVLTSQTSNLKSNYNYNIKKKAKIQIHIFQLKL